MRVVGLVSSFREGRMLTSAIESLRALDGVLVYEGPVEGNEPAGPVSVYGNVDRGKVKIYDGEWASDAVKRTAMLQKAKIAWPGELWGVWLDGDEILLWGEYLKDWLEPVVALGTPENPVGGWPISLVELDSSVAWCMGKVVRLDLIRRYLVSSSYIEMTDGTRRTVGNVDAWSPLDGPMQHVNGRPHWRARPPLQGEPHLQHRPSLRDPGRQVERQNEAEARNFEGVELTA
jgi:hypothetical protein